LSKIGWTDEGYTPEMTFHLEKENVICQNDPYSHNIATSRMHQDSKKEE